MGCEVDVDEDLIDGGGVVADAEDVDVFREADVEIEGSDAVERYVTAGVLLVEFIDITDLREKYEEAIVQRR